MAPGMSERSVKAKTKVMVRLPAWQGCNLAAQAVYASLARW
jgi:hypothetical protein